MSLSWRPSKADRKRRSEPDFLVCSDITTDWDMWGPALRRWSRLEVSGGEQRVPKEPPARPSSRKQGSDIMWHRHAAAAAEVLATMYVFGGSHYAKGFDKFLSLPEQMLHIIRWGINNQSGDGTLWVVDARLFSFWQHSHLGNKATRVDLWRDCFSTWAWNQESASPLWGELQP